MMTAHYKLRGRMVHFTGVIKDNTTGKKESLGISWNIYDTCNYLKYWGKQLERDRNFSHALKKWQAMRPSEVRLSQKKFRGNHPDYPGKIVCEYFYQTYSIIIMLSD